jgi:thioredoxin 1
VHVDAYIPLENPTCRHWQSVVRSTRAHITEKQIMGAVQEVNDLNFKSEVLDSTEPVLVDFWAPWCGPCRQIGPVIEQLANENAGSAKVVKLNVDDAPGTAQHYDVSSIPTLMIFKGGVVSERFTGVKPKTLLQQALDGVKV